jgi:hypothetical protein
MVKFFKPEDFKDVSGYKDNGGYYIADICNNKLKREGQIVEVQNANIITISVLKSECKHPKERIYVDVGESWAVAGITFKCLECNKIVSPTGFNL